MSVSMMILFPLTFVSNVIVEPETLPWRLALFDGFNPFSYLVTAMRGLMHGTATGGEITIILGMSAVLIAIFGPITMYLFKRRA